MYCSSCGKENENQTNFCVACGNSLDSSITAKNNKSGNLIYDFGNYIPTNEQEFKSYFFKVFGVFLAIDLFSVFLDNAQKYGPQAISSTSFNDFIPIIAIETIFVLAYVFRKNIAGKIIAGLYLTLMVFGTALTLYSMVGDFSKIIFVQFLFGFVSIKLTWQIYKHLKNYNQMLGKF